MVYNPATTALLRQATAQNKKTVSGTAMFLAQAARQFEIWTGQPAPAEVYATL
ncbi:Quinate/shikimate dehydrogenase [compost metagenome]